MTMRHMLVSLLLVAFSGSAAFADTECLKIVHVQSNSKCEPANGISVSGGVFCASKHTISNVCDVPLTAVIEINPPSEWGGIPKVKVPANGKAVYETPLCKTAQCTTRVVRQEQVASDRVSSKATEPKSWDSLVCAEKMIGRWGCAGKICSSKSDVSTLEPLGNQGAYLWTDGVGRKIQFSFSDGSNEVWLNNKLRGLVSRDCRKITFDSKEGDHYAYKLNDQGSSKTQVSGSRGVPPQEEKFRLPQSKESAPLRSVRPTRSTGVSKFAFQGDPILVSYTCARPDMWPNMALKLILQDDQGTLRKIDAGSFGAGNVSWLTGPDQKLRAGERIYFRAEVQRLPMGRSARSGSTAPVEFKVMHPAGSDHIVRFVDRSQIYSDGPVDLNYTPVDIVTGKSSGTTSEAYAVMEGLGQTGTWDITIDCDQR